MLFVGPTPLSGIGQVMKKYSEMFKGCEYITFGQESKGAHQHVFAFVLPIKEQVEFIKRVYNPDIVMTVCETDPVHADYKLIFDTFKCVVTPSEFCKRIFEKQFGVSLRVFRHWTGKFITNTHHGPNEPYTFYTIGNVLDQRKNIPMLINAFVKCNFGSDARLVIKATCIREVNWKIPNVIVINGLVSDEEIENIHKSSHCYVNCSNSEGVGMGAVEAAIRDKPVIITDFGGLQEYVHTPFIIKCKETTVGVDDFLFQSHMKWGDPSIEDLVLHMTKCFNERITYWNHEHTRNITSRSVLCTELANLCTTLARSSV
jgi:glycosyltransferase involved in cell wall biosynthesis